MYPHRLHKNRPATVPAGSPAVPADKQLIEIILLYGELHHDIEQKVNKIERGFKLDPPVLSGNDSDEYTLARHLDTAVGQVVAVMTPYLLLPSPFVHRVATNHVYSWEEKSIYLAMPSNWPPLLIGALRDGVHDYIVSKTAYELFSSAVPSDPSYIQTFSRWLQVYELNIQNLLDCIRNFVSERLGGVKIHPTIFG